MLAVLSQFTAQQGWWLKLGQVVIVWAHACQQLGLCAEAVSVTGCGVCMLVHVCTDSLTCKVCACVLQEKANKEAAATKAAAAAKQDPLAAPAAAQRHEVRTHYHTHKQLDTCTQQQHNHHQQLHAAVCA